MSPMECWMFQRPHKLSMSLIVNLTWLVPKFHIWTACHQKNLLIQKHLKTAWLRKYIHTVSTCQHQTAPNNQWHVNFNQPLPTSKEEEQKHPLHPRATPEWLWKLTTKTTKLTKTRLHPVTNKNNLFAALKTYWSDFQLAKNDTQLFYLIIIQLIFNFTRINK